MQYGEAEEGESLEAGEKGVQVVSLVQTLEVETS
jgi:hypothetical protein